MLHTCPFQPLKKAPLHIVHILAISLCWQEFVLMHLVYTYFNEIHLQCFQKLNIALWHWRLEALQWAKCGFKSSPILESMLSSSCYFYQSAEAVLLILHLGSFVKIRADFWQKSGQKLSKTKIF